jgi:ABC-type branched-subunit amino acid transport system ATPase component
MSLFSAHGITVHYGKTAAVANVDLEVRTGSIVGLVGHNGAGKSTLLAALAGVAQITSGRISINGTELTRTQWRRVIRAGVSYVPQGRGVFVGLTVRENLALGLDAALGLPLDSSEGQERLAGVMGAVPLLESLLERKAGQLSGGQQGLVSIGRGLIVNPMLLFLDEPSTGLAPIMVNEVLAIIKRLKAAAKTSVILVEQNIPQVLSVADYLYVLKAGSVVAAGAPEKFHNLSEVLGLF